MLLVLHRFDAFRSIFPAGTVSGAPKVRAMELVYDLEKEKRGVYAGAVGHFDFGDSIDTCIAIRTIVFKDGIAYLQAGQYCASPKPLLLNTQVDKKFLLVGGGIVHDSTEEFEYQET